MALKTDNRYNFFDVMIRVVGDLENSSLIKRKEAKILYNNYYVVYDALYYIALSNPGRIPYFYEFAEHEFSPYDDAIMSYYLRQIAFLIENEKEELIEEKIERNKLLFKEYWERNYSYKDEIFILEKICSDSKQRKPFSDEMLNCIDQHAGEIAGYMMQNMLPYFLETARQCIVKHKECPPAFIAQLRELVAIVMA